MELRSEKELVYVQCISHTTCLSYIKSFDLLKSLLFLGTNSKNVLTCKYNTY